MLGEPGSGKTISLRFIALMLAYGYGTSRLGLSAPYIPLLVRLADFAKAVEHFNKAIEVSKEIGAKGLLGQAYLSLGLLKKGMEQPDQARESLSKAINIFEELNAELLMNQAREVLASLD